MPVAVEVPAMQVAIVGAGAVGSALGATLSTVGPVTVVGHENDHVSALQTGPLEVTMPDGTVRQVDLDVVTDHAAVSEAALVVLAVKSYDTERALDDVAGFLDGADLLTVQNGLGNLELMAETVDPARVIGATTTLGVTLDAPGRVTIESSGTTRLGRPWAENGPTVAAVADRFTAAGLQASVVSDVRKAIWEKVLINVGINPVTAIGRVENGALVREPGRSLLEAAVREGARVAAAEGFRIEDPVAKALAVVEATAGNRSSMLRDVETGSRTEIGALNGAIVEHGTARGLPVPVNRTLTGAVRLLED